ncbi:MAG: CBS domain-containing protein [Halobacteria archaeon]
MVIPVGPLLARAPVTLPLGSSLHEAAVLMAKHAIGLVVITEPGDPRSVAGVLSERDIIRAVASGMDLGGPVESVAARKVIQVREDSGVGEAARLMREHRIRHLVVTDLSGALKGVLSLRNLLGEVQTLRAIIGEHEDHPPATD